MLIDVSQTISNDMPGFILMGADGTPRRFGATIGPFLTHEQSRPNYDGKAEFEITEMSFQTSIGTYLDAPRHRFRDGADISELALDRLVLDGVVIDASDAEPGRPFTPAGLPSFPDLAGKAVLFRFGWDRFWGAEAYSSYPYLSRETLRMLVEQRVGLVGVDTLNADSAADKERPAHTWLLGAGIYIVENLRDLQRLHGHAFRFFAVPVKVQGAAAFPVRAFAELAAPVQGNPPLSSSRSSDRDAHSPSKSKLEI